ncbi:hydrolase [Hafnia alvei]|nr:hydrolase [Hafnia alvei]
MFFAWDKAWNLSMRLYIALFVLLFTQLFANAANASPGHKVVADQRKSHATSSESADRKKRKPATSKKEKAATPTTTAKNKKSLEQKSKTTKKSATTQPSALATKFAKNREVARNKANSKKIDKAVLASISNPKTKSSAKKSGSHSTATLARVSNKKTYGRQRGELNSHGRSSQGELAKLKLNQNNIEIVDGKPIRLSPQHKKRYQHAKQTAMNKLMNQVGKPYRWGGASPSTGFDCSGLVYYAYQDLLSIKIPRTANEMYHLRDAAPVKKTELQKGDLVFFRINNRGAADHVGVYMGEGKFIQSPRTGEQIRISYLDNDYWQGHYVGARRVMTPKTIR